MLSAAVVGKVLVVDTADRETVMRGGGIEVDRSLVEVGSGGRGYGDQGGDSGVDMVSQFFLFPTIVKFDFVM